MKPGVNWQGILWGIILAAMLWLCLGALAFSCAGPVDSAPGQPTPTVEHYEYLPHVPRAAIPTPTPRPTTTPMPTARPTLIN